MATLTVSHRPIELSDESTSSLVTTDAAPESPPAPPEFEHTLPSATRQVALEMSTPAGSTPVHSQELDVTLTREPENATVTPRRGVETASVESDDVITELHGNTRRIRCMNCRAISSVDEVRQRLSAGDTAPECRCGGYLKPDTISFGQAMPVAEVQQSAHLSQNCDFFLVVGSTLLVQPAAHMPNYAKQNGAFLAIVNLSETPCDEICDVLIQRKAGEVLQEIINKIRT